MANPIVRGFSKLTQFSGRDTRSEFWPYVGAVVAFVFIVQSIGMGAVMADLIGKVEARAESQQTLILVEEPPADQSIRIERAPERATAPPMPDFRVLGGLVSLSMVLSVSLLAAAVSRRLHDRNIAAFWGLAPVPFLGIAAVGFPLMMANMMTSATPDFGLFGLLFLNNVAYMAALVTLIVILAQRGAPGPNRYGAATAGPEPRPVENWSTPD